MKPLERLLADLPVSGGAWLLVPAGSWQAVPPRERASSCDAEATAPCAAVVCLTPDATQLADPAWSPLLPGAGCSSGAAGQGEQAVEGEGGAAGRGHSAEAARAAAAARAGDISALRCLTLDVLLAAPDGGDRWAAHDRPCAPPLRCACCAAPRAAAPLASAHRCPLPVLLAEASGGDCPGHCRIYALAGPGCSWTFPQGTGT